MQLQDALLQVSCFYLTALHALENIYSHNKVEHAARGDFCRSRYQNLMKKRNAFGLNKENVLKGGQRMKNEESNDWKMMAFEGLEENMK